MKTAIPRHLPSGATLQVAAILIGFLGLALCPPANGEMLLIPLTRDAVATMIPLAIGHDGRLLGPGPLPNSYIVYGARTALFGTLVGHGVAVVAAPGGGCGAPEVAA